MEWRPIAKKPTADAKDFRCSSRLFDEGTFRQQAGRLNGCGTRLAIKLDMRIHSAVIAMATGFLTSGCLSMPPVTLEATPADMEILAGQWNGEYSSPALGRRGSIEFKLVASTKEASGGVIMTPQGPGRPYERDSLQHAAETSGGQPPSQLLTIRFVRASAGAISGILDPYWDPDRNCEARTVFNGSLEKQTIEGTFTTTFDCGAGEASGRWHVTKKPSQPSTRAKEGS